MENKIEYKDFNYYCEKAVNPDSSVTVDELIKIHSNLKHKEVTDTANIVDSGKMLLYCVLGKSFHVPEYESVQKDFLATDYVSNEMKEILAGTIGKGISPEVKELLSDGKHFNEYSCNEINEIVNELIKDAKASHMIPRIALVNYLFTLDGEGPVEYLKSSNSEKGLALLILQHSGVCTHFEDTDDILIEKSFGLSHLVSVYKKYLKYMPEHKESFVEFVNNINFLTEYNFVENYSTYINNGFNADFSYFDHDEWYRRLSDEDKLTSSALNASMHERFNEFVNEKTLSLKQS